MAKNNGYLIDTHALLFFWGEPRRLSRRARGILLDGGNRILVSSASAWEIATKVRLGKLPAGELVVRDFEQRLREDGFLELPITSLHSLRAGSLPGPHRDPFDRMLAAQSLIEQLPVLSSDKEIEALGAARVW